MTVVAQGGEPGELALILGVGALPAVFGSLVTPLILGRMGQKVLFLTSCGIWVVVASVTAVVVCFHGSSLLLFLIVSFVLEFVAATMYPAMGSYLPLLVKDSDLGTANSLRAVLTGIVQVAGPALAAVLVAAGFLWQPWAGTAVLLGVALVVQTGLPKGEKAHVEEAGVLETLRSGLRYFRSCKGILRIVVYSAVWHFFGYSVFMVAGPVVIRDGYSEVWLWGFLESGMALGGIVGGLFGRTFEKAPVGIVCIVSLFPLLALMGCLSFTVPAVVVVGVGVLFGAALTVGGIAWTTAIQRSVPQGRLAEIFAYDYLFSDGFAPVGYLFAPVILLMGTTTAMVGVAVFLLILGCVFMVRFPAEFAGKEPSGVGTKE